MDATTKRELVRGLTGTPDDTLMCPECFHFLEWNDEGCYYCPNEMCLNEETYDTHGNDYS